jgi:hypothetical protein
MVKGMRGKNAQECFEKRRKSKEKAVSSRRGDIQMEANSES